MATLSHMCLRNRSFKSPSNKSTSTSFADRILSLNTVSWSCMNDWITARGVRTFISYHPNFHLPRVDIPGPLLVYILDFPKNHFGSQQSLYTSNSRLRNQHNTCVDISMEILLLLVSRVSMALSQGTGAIHSWKLASRARNDTCLYSPVIRGWDLSILWTLWYCSWMVLTCSFRQLPKSYSRLKRSNIQKQLL
jgi:hypothetical protein